MASPSNAPRVIAVEGKTDMHVVLPMLKAGDPRFADCKVEQNSGALVVQLPGDKDRHLAICEEGNIENLSKRIKTRLQVSGLERIGFVFDANSNPDNRWKQIRGRVLDVLPDLETSIPEKPSFGGVWVAKSNPAVGMWMMPDNKNKGAIEEFLVPMIDSKDHCWKQAQNYVEEVSKKRKDFPKRMIFPERKTMKAKIHAWLAVQENPGSPPGTAIRSGYFNPDTPETQSFRDWLKNLQ